MIIEFKKPEYMVWRRWFAWYPVEVGFYTGKFVWLQFIERRLNNRDYVLIHHDYRIINERNH